MRLKMKNIPKYDINRPRPRHGHKYTKCKLCLGKVKQDWIELKKSAYIFGSIERKSRKL